MASPSDLTVQSGRVKTARRLATRSFREKTGEFLAEGPQAVREALTVPRGEPGSVIEVFATVDATDRYEELAARADQWHVVTDDVVAAIADSVTPQGMVARCHSLLRWFDDYTWPGNGFVAAAVDIRDPGNAGSLIRAADAAGAAAVYFLGDCVDPQNPKAVRAAVGSHFHLPVVVDRDLFGSLAKLRESGARLLAADAAGDVNLFTADLSSPVVWVFGNEAHGLDRAVTDAVDEVVSIPLIGRAESLNLATAAAVCLYASAREQH
ncbi:MAG TPA: RNA methyltransferase [Aeromicrobium sp.]|nr:RNA methyltransferase [Aeromicrobium sp.]